MADLVTYENYTLLKLSHNVIVTHYCYTLLLLHIVIVTHQNSR